MKQRRVSFSQAMLGGWTMLGGQTKQGELCIALTHEDHKPIIFDGVLKAGNSVLLAAKLVIKNPDEVLPQSDRTWWTSFDGYHHKVLQGQIDRQG